MGRRYTEADADRLRLITANTEDANGPVLQRVAS